LDDGEVAFQQKPYLQPFEEALSLQELSRCCLELPTIDEPSGLYVARPAIPTSELRERLVYWQRLGSTRLAPTRQVLLESSQTEEVPKKGSNQLHNTRRLRYGTHDLHEYRGKFFPQLVGSLLNIADTTKGSVVLDPMCGSGTTIVEAIHRGMDAYGCDLNPLSTLISRTKSELLCKRPESLERQVDAILSKVRSSSRVRVVSPWAERDSEYLERWFSPEALIDLSLLLQLIRETTTGTYRRFFEICLSDIIRKASFQDIDDLRVRKVEKSYEPGLAQTLFQESVISKTARVIRMLRLITPADPDLIHVASGDARQIDRIFSEIQGKVDVIVTSPPYATALPYLDTDRLSLTVLGLTQRKHHKDYEIKMIGTREISERQRQNWWTTFEERGHELPTSVSNLVQSLSTINHCDGVGFRRRNLPALLGAYFLSMLDSMASSRRLMKRSGKAFYVVGNNSTNVDGLRVEIRTNELLVEIGECAGWKPSEVMNMELLNSRDIFRKNRGTAESILTFEA
jgi:site-specific DNA-methyltransferase (cytosine-N4-specific)